MPRARLTSGFDTDAHAAARTARRAPAPLPRARCVLLLVDVIHPLHVGAAEALAPAALAAAPHIAALKRGLASQGVPTAYVNDNLGRWHEGFERMLARCRAANGDAASLVRRLAPARGDITLLKPRHSAFYGTALQLLLTQMGARELVIAGFATDLCVLLTAADAYERGYHLWVPADCCAAESPSRHAAALAWLREALHARTDPAGPAAGAGTPFADARRTRR